MHLLTALNWFEYYKHSINYFNIFTLLVVCYSLTIIKSEIRKEKEKNYSKLFTLSSLYSETND